jgi:flagellar protein FliS
VVMLYDGFLKFTHRAQASIQRGDTLDTTRAVGRALDILNELVDALDHGPAPDISRPLESLYLYIGDRLLHVSARQDSEALEEVIILMGDLRQGWSEALIKVRSQQAA